MIIRKSIAEFFGTFCLVFIGTGSIVFFQNSGDHALLWISLSFGLVVTALVYLLKDISGAHINPSVSIALCLTKHLKRSELPYYLISQFLGAISASMLVSKLFPGDLYLGGTHLSLGYMEGIGLEIPFTILLMASIYFVALGKGALKSLGPIAIGFVIFTASMIAGPYTGASLNPARSAGPALISGMTSDLWFYLFVPTIGAVLIIPLYQKLNNG